MADDPLAQAWTATARTVPIHVRRASWQALASAAAHQDFIASNAAELSRLVLHTLTSRPDIPTQRAVLKTLRHALKSNDFIKEFASGLVKDDICRPPPGTATTLLLWSTLTLQHLNLPTAQKAATKLIECQAAWLGALAASGQRHTAAQHAVSAALAASPALQECYVTVATSTKSAPLVRVIWANAAKKSESAAAVSQQLQQVFVDGVLSAKERSPAHLLACYAPLLGAATAEQISTTLLPAVLRMIRRSPEAALASSTFMLGALRQDLSGAAAEVMPVLAQQAKHAKEPVRKLAAAATAAFAERVGDPSALQTCVDVVTKVLDGSEGGKIKSPQERASLAAALEALAASKGRGESIAAVAHSACTFLSVFYKEEITDEGRLALLRALGAWLPRCSAVPAATASRLSEGLKEKEGLRRGHLRALVKGLSGNAELRGRVGDLAPALSKLIAEGAAKVASRVDGLLALLAAAYIAWADVAADAALEKDGAWAAVEKADSPLLAAATAAKLAPEDAAVHAELCSALLTLHARRLGGDSSPAASAASRTLALLLLHFNSAARAAAITAATAVASADLGLQLGLLAALHHWVANIAEVGVIQDPAEAEAAMAEEAVHERYLHALLACIPRSHKGEEAPPSAALVSAALLLAHHPTIAAARRGSDGAWRAVRTRLGAVQRALEAAPSDIAAELVLGVHGVNSEDPREQAAAFGALSAAAVLAASALFRPTLDALAPQLDTAVHDSLTARQLRVYATPRGRTSNESEDGSIIPVELFEEMLADKASIQPPIFPPEVLLATPAKEEAAPPAKTAVKAAPTRPSMAAAAAARSGGKPPGKAPAKDAAAEARARQLLNEAEVRAGVVAVRERLARGLIALGAFGSGDASFCASHLEELAAPALPLLTSPLVGSVAAFACLRPLVGCIPGAIGNRALDVAAALRLVAQTDAAAAPDYQRLARQSCVVAAVDALLVATGGSPAEDGESAVLGSWPLPGPAYILCFPILRAVLSCQRPTPLHDAALGVVSLHVGPGTQVPKTQAFELLYHVINILPALRDRVQGLLRTLCSSIAPGDVPALRAAVRGLSAGEAFARRAALAALAAAPAMQGVADEEVLTLLWMACSDENFDNAAAAKELWESTGGALPATFITHLTQELASPFPAVRTAAAGALAAGVAQTGKSAAALAAAIDLFVSGRSPAARMGAAAALQALAPRLSPADVDTAMEFFLGAGLMDTDQSVRMAMVAAGVAVVDAAGPPAATTMLPLVESYLERKTTGRGAELSEDAYDHVRQGAVVFLGTLARHMDPTSSKVKSIIDTLLEVLKTPSEAVQRSVSDCLPPLMPALQPDAEFVETIMSRLLQQALKGASYGDRRGAAYGLAGAVKGLGLSSLKKYGVMDALKAGAEEKADAGAREGALCCFECLSDKLGRLFEPYVIHILPTLLTAFGDPSPGVREAAVGAARVIMGQLSAQGVKLVLPALLKGIEDRTWRTKQGSVQLLGAMAHCAPKQLSACLPTIVPRLGEVLADPHPKVCAAAKQALDEVGSVIRNPEVSQLVPTLLSAVADPNKNNKAALDLLLSTVFINTIDAASLALIVPVVHRGLRDRSGDVKKRAARIVGNLCKLVNDSKDMTPYVPLLLPEVQSALLDPLPEVRATAARALGSLTLGMGSEALGDTTPWLLEKMRSESSAVERSGAAQGLAEVLAVQGAGALEEVLPDVIAGCSARTAAAREGSLTLFKYLPYTMPEVFRPHLPVALPCVLDGLADESEGVRDAALSSGRVAVELYATTALTLLLPTVEGGMLNVNWRIRQSSVELLGDLLFKVAGTTGRIQQDVQDEEAEGISVEAHGKAIVDALGMAKRNEVLARLYIARSDVAYTVRSAALHVWKTVVTNTPKTLGEILPALMTFVIAGLAASDEDSSEMASRCLGELVRKMGDRVLAQILPILKENVQSEDASTRAGVCCGLREVMENCTRNQLADNLAELLPAVQGALCDSDAGVRAAAGGVINVLFKSGGGANIDAIIPSLLQGLESKHEQQAKQALEGLRVVLSVRPQLLSSMAPRLIKAPVTATNLTALGALAEVAGPSIHSHLAVIMPTLLVQAGNHPDVSPAAAAAHAALAAVAAAVAEDGLHLFMAEVHRGLDEAGPRRRGAAAATTAFCKASKLDFQEHVPGLISSLVPLLAEDDADTLAACWAALSAVMASIPKEMAPSFVRTLKEAVQAAKDRERRKKRAGSGPVLVPGFCLPKALTPVLPVYLQGVLQGSSAELRELAAEGLGELVEVTGGDALKPFVVQITGPLIRIIGDRFPWQTKAAILKTMGLLVGRAGVGLRPFIPQLQTTFVKCLTDPAQGVRQRAAVNLGELTTMALRLDQLVGDLASGARSAEPAVQEAYLTAMEGALVASGERLAPATLASVGSAVREACAGAGDDEILLRAAAGAMGAYAARCSTLELQEMLESSTLAPPTTGRYGERLGAALVAAAVAQRVPARLEEAGLRAAFLKALVRLGKDESVEVKQAAGKAAGRLVASELEESSGASSPSLPTIVPLLMALLGPDQHTDVQRQALAVLRKVAAAAGGAGVASLPSHYPDLVPSVLGMIQDSSGSSKLAAERTLARVLQLEAGPEATQAFLSSGRAGSLARTMLTEPYCRRLTRLPATEEDDLKDYAL